MIKVVFFDIDNTLLDHSGAHRMAGLEMHKKYFPSVPKEKFLQIWSESTNKYWEAYEAGKISFEDQQVERVINVWSQLGINVDSAEARRLFDIYSGFYENEWKAFEGMPQLLNRIAVKMGILTNGARTQQMKKLDKMNISKLFDKKLIFTPEEIEKSKPDRGFFKRVELITGCAPEEILFIGDDLHTDIIPANSMGWNTIWFNFYGVNANDPENKGHDSVADLDALNKVIAFYE